MHKGISLSRIWSDDDLVELRILVTDAVSSFCNDVYVGHGELADLVSELKVFRDHIHGGIKDIRFGAFGPEYANGAFHGRLHFRHPGKLYVSTHQQSDFSSFSVGDVASKAKLYLVSEPILLDNFISELGALANGVREHASLQCA